MWGEAVGTGGIESRECREDPAGHPVSEVTVTTAATTLLYIYIVLTAVHSYSAPIWMRILPSMLSPAAGTREVAATWYVEHRDSRGGSLVQTRIQVRWTDPSESLVMRFHERAATQHACSPCA